MSVRIKNLTLAGTSAAAASTTVLGTLYGLSQFDDLRFDAVLAGATGGVLDIYLQRKLAADVWLDWCRFTQLAASGAKRYSFSAGSGSNTITEVGLWADAGTGTQVLTANACLGGHPGDAIRMVGVAGSGTSAGAAQTIYVTGITRFS